MEFILSFLLPLFGIEPISVSAPPCDTAKILFMGDVMSHGPQIRAALIAGKDSLNSDSYDFSSYFKYIQPQLDSADLVVANMEFTTGVKPFTGYPTFSAPNALPVEAGKCGIDLFLTANNHICDKGKRGLDSTYALYQRMNVAYTGFYPSMEDEEHDNPFIMDVSGIRVAFINFTYGVNGNPIPEPYVVNLLDTTHVTMVIERAKERGAEFIIATPHWGEEYHLDISDQQKRWCDFLYLHGVNAIIGTHPHVVQKTEYDTTHATAYSLGNYISNMSIVNGQIGMLYTLTIIKDENGHVSILPPEVKYLWCARKGTLEKNYTVIPIVEYIDKEEAFIDKSQYRKMVSEWNGIKIKFNIQ